MRTIDCGKARTLAIASVALAAALAASACHEIPQDARKPFAGKEDVQPYVGSRFNGDKQKFEQALAQRAQFENEYLRTGESKK